MKKSAVNAPLLRFEHTHTHTACMLVQRQKNNGKTNTINNVFKRAQNTSFTRKHAHVHTHTYTQTHSHTVHRIMHISHTLCQLSVIAFEHEAWGTRLNPSGDGMTGTEASTHWTHTHRHTHGMTPSYVPTISAWLNSLFFAWIFWQNFLSSN